MIQGLQPHPSQLNRFVADSLPIAALVHSYLVELRWEPRLRGVPSLEEFSDNALHELHHLTALRGALLRLDRGDPTAWSSVGLNLARLLHRRQITMERAARLPAAVRQDPRGRFMLSLIDQGNRQLQRYLPIILQTIRATGWSKAAPMVFRP